MSSISLRMDDRDSELIKKYAALHRTTVSEYVRNTVIERIEDEMDIGLFDKALKAMTKTHSLDEVKAELGL